ncbi:hypothetical protein DYBT9275_03097 [Dyadobacter sp. CECT 9275]|uniref:Uncharacterized protein n=1 Tax=Dyadobacter helix TaxID=2822344 RepID=A0A916N6E9_9BACT|nr:hypothetical protein DYBT9275_03097 [Dyadobacter sp. CECT 9275]
MNDHFTADFSAEKDGVYRLTISKSARELGGTNAYQF